MSQDRFSVYASVHFLFIKGNEVLLLLRKNITSDGLYGLVAGHLDEGETVTDAFVREAKEETGVDIKSEDIKISTVCHSYSRHNNREFIQFYAVCKKWSGEFINKEPEKCGDIKFFPVDNLPENIVPYIKDAIKKVLDGVNYYEYGWKDGE
ncbi:MAG: NUDIX domain-containing protein [Patescibacteria group bacterium]